MSIKLGIYDFFSYLIPGGIVIAVFIFILDKHLAFGIDFGNLSIVEFLVAGTLSYLIGFATDFVAGKTWYKLFRKNDLFEVTMSEFNKRHPTIEVQFQEMDWFIPFSFVKKQSLEMAQDIDKFNVINKMLRNSSFGILLFAITFAVEFFLESYSLVFAALSVLCLFIAIILAQQSVKFAKWFFQSIFQSLVAVVATPEQMPVKFKSKSKRSKPDTD